MEAHNLYNLTKPKPKNNFEKWKMLKIETRLISLGRTKELKSMYEEMGKPLRILYEFHEFL